MSEETTQDPKVAAFAKEFNDYVQEMMKRLNAKFPGKLEDAALVINWSDELKRQPVPKMIVETFRDDKTGQFDPVMQTLEISDLLTFGSSQMLRQLVSVLMQQNIMLQQRLSAVSDATIQEALSKPKLIVPGQ